ncbi:MAG: YraN family protein [Microcoleaceae cyanobacterium MO_207.B10]|nr:YraN family protein [Microcoleaceae cyanobacterium MO_207.B10]
MSFYSSGQSSNSVSSRFDKGLLGEEFVAQWLRQQGWQIIQRRWRCRWGELDIIAIKGSDLTEVHSASCPMLVFVEVKTRGHGNWDRNGLLALTEAKQAKLWQTAEMFLADYPELVDYPCRFDVGLVSCNFITGRDFSEPKVPYPPEKLLNLTIKLGHPVMLHGYQLILEDYMISAFVNES